LFIYSASHARGYTFHIYALKEGVTVKGSFPSKEEGVEVYGVVGGNPGWTESYGWLHNGKWQDDFRRLVEDRRDELERVASQSESEKAAKEAAEQERVKSLLSQY
jgi:predicted aminopeptidase